MKKPTCSLSPAKLFISSLLLLLVTASALHAQGRVTYNRLAGRSVAPNIYIDYFALPGADDSTLTYAATFRMDYAFLPFKKVDQPSGGRNFFSTASLSWEIFRANRKESNRDRVSVEGLNPAGRAFWKDTVYAESYEQTQSSEVFEDGFLQVDLKPGLYNYILQLVRGEEVKEQNSRSRQVQLEAYGDIPVGDILPVASLSMKGEYPLLRLLNFGDRVHYGKDYYAFIHLPRYDAGATYTLKVSRVDASAKDTTRESTVFTKELGEGELYTGVRPSLESDQGAPAIYLSKGQPGYAYALVKIPNSTFANAAYRLTVRRDGADGPVARALFRSLWLDMPTSLLNLGVAIDMTKYIVDEQTLKRLKSGSAEEREQKFRAFWKSKDPTPDTEFNELMAEYYRRVDYAYNHFTTPNIAGQESDQGRIYIQYGPPNQVERNFPPGEKPVEIWTYDQREFVFRATTGFGDFQLVSNRKASK